jgi:hypothetical protein
MILVDTSGGFGNQMFQFSLGYILSKKHRQPLVIKDEIFYDKTSGISFEIFPNVSYQLASQKQIEQFYLCGIKRCIKNILLLPHYTIYEEETLKYDLKVFKTPPPLYIKGFWQSEKYFSGYEDCIRDVFSFNSRIDTITNYYYQKISSKYSSVAIHVRRGDYLFNEQNFLRHGVCSLDYYKIAIEDMRKKVSAPYFFVFSDDQEWCEKNICTMGSDFEFVKTNNSGSSSWKDMFLMSKCKNQIMANSTFSWWAAWLNNNIDKTIIAPTQWFADDKLELLSGDIVPQKWIRL